MSSLRPELEFELLKLVLLREHYLQRLKKKVDTDNSTKDVRSKGILKGNKNRDVLPVKAKMDMGLIGLFEYIRDCSMQVVEKIHTWERTQLTYPEIVTYKWNGQNYLEKISTDLEFLEEYSYIVRWAGFSVINNPFLVPPEVFLDELMVPQNAIMEFGGAPPVESAPVVHGKPTAPFTKSPYLTPIINDPQVFTHLSARSKLNAKFSAVRSATPGDGDGDDNTYNDGTATGNNTYRSNATRSSVKVAVKSETKEEINPYKTYLNSEMIKKLRICWKILQKLDVTGRNTALNRTAQHTGASVDGYDGDSVRADDAGLMTASQARFYDESKVFNNSMAESQDALHAGSAGPVGQQQHSAENSAPPFVGFYGTSTQSLSPSGQLMSPSLAQQTAFQNNKEYFQQSLHATSGALYGTQDAQNQALRMFSVLPPSGGATTAGAGSTASAGQIKTGEFGAPLEPSVGGEGANDVYPSSGQQGSFGTAGLAEGSAGTWGSADELAANYRVHGVQGVHPNPGVHNDTSAPGTTLRGTQIPNAPLVPQGTQGSVEIGQGLATTSSQLWTPHEIHLQTQVQRRGGELYVLTAAGTQGRMKTPWRRTRFERLEEDVRLLHEQSVMMHMAVEEAVTRAVLRAEQLALLQPGYLGSASGEEKSDSNSRRVSFQHSPIYSGPTTARPDSSGKRPRSAGPVLPVGRAPPALARPAAASPVIIQPQSAGSESLAPPSSTPFAPAPAAPAQSVAPAPKTEFSPVSSSTVPVSSRPVTPPGAGATAASPLMRPGGAVDEARLQALRQRALETRAREEASDEGEDEGTDEEVSDGDEHATATSSATAESKSNAESEAAVGAGKEATTQTDMPDNVEGSVKVEEVPPPRVAPVYKVDRATAQAIRDLKIMCIDVDRRKTFKQYQYDHFKLVSTGNLTDISKQRRLHSMEEGQTLEEDQAIAMSIEDKMAFKIQRRIRIRFGRALRVAMIRKMNVAACRIQNIWRRCKVHMLSLQRSAQLRLALILQRWYRGGSVNETMRKLKRDALERVASKTLQRVFRGYLGRRRLNLKREFVGCLTRASAHVSIKELTPGHIEELADCLDMFVRDYTIDLPTAVLSVLRAVFYVFNGDNSECVVVNKDGYIEKKYIRAATATWQGAKLILRRKSRFLRRLRALISNTCLPNPSKFAFSADCKKALQAVVEGVKEADFDEVEVGKYAILKLLEYCRCIHRASQLQDLFPEYFDPGQSAWFRYLMNIRQKYDRADLLRRIQSKCKFRLESQRREYTREGKSWRHVADATKRNEFDLEEARILRTKCKKRYESYVAELEAAEIKKVVTLEGIVRAKALSVQVAQGDLKEYVQAVVIPDETRLRELYYAVDTRSLSLLQTRAEIVKTMELNERNKQSRDYDKIMKTKKLHDICADLGAVLADLMVLLNNWKSLLKTIGGFQYVKDLVGQRKTYYDHIRKTSLALMKKRRTLLESFEEDLQAQYDKVIQLAYELATKATNTYWDSPTAVEVEAEAEENRECCRREADFELRQRRQTEHVHIPAAPFHPVLLLIDSRVPRKLREYLTENLIKFDFQVCKLSQTDDNLVLDMQRIIDEKKYIILFANRGAHSLARLTFLSSFNSVLSGLIPTPHVVALDSTLALRVEDWHTMFCVEQSGMTAFNVGDSANCDLSLGKIRKLSSIFRECLVYENGDMGQSDSESDEDTDHEHSRPGMSNSRRASSVGPGAGVAGTGTGTGTGENSGEAAGIGSRGNSVAVSQSGAKDRSNSVTFAPSVIAALPSRPRRRLDAVQVPVYVRKLFMTDFHNFITHIAQKLPFVRAGAICQLTTRRDSTTGKLSTTEASPEFSNSLLYSDMVLAATLSTILNLWQAPLMEWTGRDIARGSNAFRKRCAKLTYNELCEILEMREFADSGVITCKRLDKAMALTDAWSELKKHDFYVHPARNILVRWACEMVELMNRFSTRGGRADENFRNCNAAHVQHLRWYEDVLDGRNGGVELLGELLYACMRNALIYENRNCNVKYYYDRGNLSSTERQCIDSFMTPQHVCVYHSNEETFVGVKVDGTRLARGQSVPNWKFFSRMRVRDLITMLQPNYTEIVEGKVRKFNIKEGGTHKWYKLLSEWASMDNISDKFQITLLRSRYLVLSKLGMIKGYLIRMEIFEERFGEVRILVYGVHPTGAVNYLVDRKKVYDLMNYCDVHAEKDKLDALDTQSVAYIFSDRLEIRPSKMWQHFLSHGELLPKTLDREVQLNLRKRQGPGRYAGRKVLHIGSIRLVITLYELDSDTNSHELRVVLYETRHSQTAEFRLSSMERLMLFQDDVPILEQICGRLRHVYCDLTDKTRTLIVLEKDDVPALDAPFEIDGDEEYEIRSQASDGESSEEEAEEGSEDSDDDTTEQPDSRSTSEQGEKTKEKRSRKGRRRSSVSRFSTSSKKDRSGSRPGSRRGSRRMSRVSKLSSVNQDDDDRPPSGWGWAIYLNRAIISETKGNLIISVGVSVPLRGVTFFILDPRTQREAYRLVSFFDACALLSDKTLESLENDLGNMDESVAFDLADEFIALVEVQNDDDEKLSLVLSGEETEVDNILLARLGEFTPPVRADPRAKKKATIPVQKVTIFVHGAKDLERIGAFGTRNPVCIVKWNFREIGRTKIARGTLAPRWNNASFLVMTPKNQELKDCSLDLELFDTSADGKNKLTDFLGCIKISGDNLVEFLDSERPRWVECEKAKRFHGEENRHAHGFIEVSGTRKDTAVASHAAEAEDKVGELTKAPGFGVSARFGAGWFAASSRSLAAPAEDAAAGAAPSTARSQTSTTGPSPEKSQATAGAPPSPSVAATPAPAAPVVPAPAPSLGMLSKAFSIKSPFMRAASIASFGTPSVIAEESSVASNSLAAQAAPGVTWHDPTPQVDASDAPELFENSVELPDSELPAPVVPFYLGIVGADGLPSGTDVTCTIKFNGYVVQELSATTNHDNYMSAKAEFYDAPLMLTVPAGLPLAACILELELARKDTHHHKIVPLSRLELRGTMLVNFLRRGRQSTEMKRIAPAQAASHMGMLGTAGMALLTHGSHDAGADAKPCKMQLIASYKPIRQERYELNVVSARNLPKADVFGSSDPFTKLILDGRLVGQTQVIKNNINPTWNETFVITLPLETSVADCSLLVEVYDHDTVSDHDLLGTVTVSGPALLALLCPDATQDIDAQSTLLALEMEQKVKGKMQKVACGDITLRGGGSLVPLVAAEREQDQSSSDLGLLLQDQERQAAGEFSGLEAERTAAQKLVDDAYEELHNSIPEEYLLSVNTARGLINTDSLKNSHTYVNVYFNGELVGHTAEVRHAPVLDWKSPTTHSSGGAHAHAPTSASTKAAAVHATASTVITLRVPRGQLLSACRLELEVVAAEHHTHLGLHTTTTTTCTVLGARTITGKQLEELLNGGTASKSSSPTNKAAPGARKVSVAAQSTDAFFDLQASKRPLVGPAVKTSVNTAAAGEAAGPESAVSTKNVPAKSEKASNKHRGAAPLDAAAMAASSNAAAATAAALHAALPINLTPQGEVGFTIRRSSASGGSAGSDDAGEEATGPGKLKNIVIEEPELIRENSTLLVDLQTMQGWTKSILFSKSKAKSDHSAASHSEGSAPTTAASTPEVIDIYVRWNGVQVERFFAHADMKTGSLQWPQVPSVSLRLPLNLQIQDCHLEMLLWHGNTHLGSAVFWGEALAGLCGAPVLDLQDGDDDGSQEGGRKSDNNTADGLSADQKAIMTTGESTWRSLTPSPLVPTTLHVPTITGRMLLKATLTRPISQKDTSGVHKLPIRRRSLYHTITTELPADKKHWTFHFDARDEGEAGSGDEFEADPDGHHATRQRRDSAARMAQSPSIQARKRVLSEISKQSSATSLPNAASDTAGEAAGRNVPAAMAALAAAAGVGAVPGVTTEHAKVQKLQLELAAVSFTVTVHQEIDEYRTCWRGRVMPKNFTGSEGTRKAMLVGRASRLVRTHGIIDMQVMAEIHQLTDVGDEAEEVNDLPICVKEILSEGPELVLRTYRVEISANNGVMMGSADIKDNERDIARCIGAQWVEGLLPKNRKLWKLGAIFQHIVRERVVLDMLMGKGKQEGKDGRREGIIQHHEQLADLSGSIITVIRDPSAEELAKAARIVQEAEEQKAATEAAKTAQQAAAPASSSFGINLGFKGFGFGFGKTANSAVPAGVPLPVLREDEPDLENVNTNETLRNSTRGSYSTRTNSVNGDALEQTESYKTGRQWLRIHARTHRVVGKPLRSVVLLLTTPRTDAMYFENADRYFRNVLGRTCLLQFDVLFRCKNSFTKETRELYLSAQDLDEWLPQSFEVDLTKKFRRDKFGAYLLQYLSVRFTEAGEVELYLIKENVNVSSSIDDLIAEDEQQQAAEERKAQA